MQELENRFGIIPKDKTVKEFVEDGKSQMKIFNNHLKTMKVDMIDIKDAIKGTIYFKRISPTPTPDICRDDIVFDYWNFELVKILSTVKNPRDESVGRLVDEFELAYSQITDELSDFDKLIFHHYQNEYKAKNPYQIAEEYGTTFQAIYKRIDRIIQLIQRKMIENYELDYYYTEIVRGNWKKCSKCGEIYPRNEYYWSKDKRLSDGLRSYCKKCQAKMDKK